MQHCNTITQPNKCRTNDSCDIWETVITSFIYVYKMSKMNACASAKEINGVLCNFFLRNFNLVLNIDGSNAAFHTQWSCNSSRAHAVFAIIFSLGDCIRGAAQWGTSPVWLSFDTDGAEWKQKVQPRCPSISPVVQPTSALPFHLPNIAFVRKSFTLRQKQKSILEQNDRFETTSFVVGDPQRLQQTT